LRLSEFYGRKKAQEAQKGGYFRQDKGRDSEGIFLTTHGFASMEAKNTLRVVGLVEAEDAW